MPIASRANRFMLKVEGRSRHPAQPALLFSKSPTRPTQRYETRGEAREMRFEGADNERFFDTRYTTCKPGEDDWYFCTSRNWRSTAQTNTGTGHHGRIEFMGVPILYLPYMTFPLNSDRKSGFLAPTFGSSSKSGLEISAAVLPEPCTQLRRHAPRQNFVFQTRAAAGREFRYLSPMPPRAVRQRIPAEMTALRIAIATWFRAALQNLRRGRCRAGLLRSMRGIRTTLHFAICPPRLPHRRPTCREKPPRSTAALRQLCAPAYWLSRPCRIRLNQWWPHTGWHRK